MSKRSRQRRREARQNRTRVQRTRWSVLAGLALVVVVGGVLAVRASGGSQPAAIRLYQGAQQLGVSGNSIDLADVIGHGEPTVVNFWASNCPPCRMEMPGFQQVYAQHFGQGYRMLGVDVGPQTGLGSHAGAQALIGQLGIQYPVGYVEDNTLVARYGLRGMPTTMFFDASGKVVGKVVGYLPEATLRQRLAALLAGGS
jgi:thiol-disulfide isomerase/thioredoxin